LVILPSTNEETAAILSFFAIDTSILDIILIRVWHNAFCRLVHHACLQWVFIFTRTD
jgi:hypothetical protein